MTTINLGAEGEYGRRLVRYLERHMGSEVRLVHYTKPCQWPAKELGKDLAVMSSSFFESLDDQPRELMDLDRVIWIRDTDEEDGYCRFHPPDELAAMIERKIGTRIAVTGGQGEDNKITGIFSPVYEEKLFGMVRPLLQPGDLYLGMEDIGAVVDESGAESDGFMDKRGHMGDLCYYIHLKGSGLVSRIGELSIHDEEGYEILPSPMIFLSLVELSAEEYLWFFEQLRSNSDYGHIYVGLGCGMFAYDRILSCFDRLILVGSRHNRKLRKGCDLILRSVQAGYGGFTGSCEMVFREDIMMGGSPDG